MLTCFGYFLAYLSPSLFDTKDKNTKSVYTKDFCSKSIYSRVICVEDTYIKDTDTKAVCIDNTCDIGIYTKGAYISSLSIIEHS